FANVFSKCRVPADVVRFAPLDPQGLTARLGSRRGSNASAGFSSNKTSHVRPSVRPSSPSHLSRSPAKAEGTGPRGRCRLSHDVFAQPYRRGAGGGVLHDGSRPTLGGCPLHAAGGPCLRRGAARREGPGAAGRGRGGGARRGSARGWRDLGGCRAAAGAGCAGGGRGTGCGARGASWRGGPRVSPAGAAAAAPPGSPPAAPEHGPAGNPTDTPPAPPSRGAAQPALSRRPAGRTGAARARPLFQTNCVAKVSFRWREETVSPALPPLPRHPPPARRGTAGTPRAGAGAAAAAGPGEGRGGTSQGPALLPPPAPRPPPRSVPPAPRVHRGLMAVGTAGPRSPARPERRPLPAPAEGGAARPVGAGRAERGTAPGPRSAAFIWGRRGAPRSSRSSPAAVQPPSPPRPGTRRPAGKETGPFRISSKRPPPI
ncbi:basic proline-rich protein-like, partial [Falco biarmicus]|uniref:basic proline-rich protein-like n=1 Tax=Falco biarmicus TaxID=345155 RepID=UPI0024BD1FDD